jgi:isocitrate dehydrogenase
MEEMLDTGRVPHTVGDLMTRTLITVTDAESVEDAMHHMQTNNISCVVVEPNGKGEWGILTRRDIVTKIVKANQSPATKKVMDIASRPVVSVPAETSIREAANILSERNFSRLTVSQGDKIIGIVTETDIFDAVEKFGWAAEQV